MTCQGHHLFGKFLSYVLCLTLISCRHAFNANDVVPTLPEGFDMGVNMGYYPPWYSDKALAALATQFGAQSIRPGLFHHFLDRYGYDSRLPEFSYYRDSLGLRNIVAIIGYPSETARDTQTYCSAQRSALFKHLYQPIWDQGENGTPVNDENPYALYVWETARRYKGLIKIYEIWNEPDFNTDKGWRPWGMPGNWWQSPPQPCDTRLYAPFFHYLRTLRISYEVIKRVDPEALVAVGGLGWPSYLDAICRYTDEPLEGEVDPEHYPYKGGAYFDCMSFHAYPQLLNPRLQNSDAALDAMWRLKSEFETVLLSHAYDDIVYPSKHWICSEFNIPRQNFGAKPDSAQINFWCKSMVMAPAHGMRQMHLYSLADEKTGNATDPAFASMGMFQNLENVKPGNARPNNLAWAYKTVSSLLNGFIFDSTRTRELQLPENIRGGAFSDKTGRYVYVLWAITSNGNSENAEAAYAFPEALGLQKLEARFWDFSRSGVSVLYNANHLILNGSPVFLSNPE